MGKKFLLRETVEPSWLEAFFEGGQRVSGARVAKDWSFDCEAPVSIELTGTVEAKQTRKRGVHRTITKGNTPVFLDLKARCRKCPSCLAAKRWHWTARALAEFASCDRTWFVTLTINPVNRSRFEMKTLERLRRGGTRHPDLTAAEWFTERAKTIQLEITKMLKRIRKNTAAKMTYILVTEAHKDGTPHFHLLIHEKQGSITKVDIQGQWPFGFSTVKLADKSRAFYVTKYVTKSTQTRVRASLHYGDCQNCNGAPIDGENPIFTAQ